MIKVLNENGFKEAMFGLGLNKNIIDIGDYAALEINKHFDKTFGRMYDIARKLAGKGNGHDKFLETMNVNLYIEAPRFIWQEFDTYRVGISKQSESTMNSIRKLDLSLGLFEPLELNDNKEDFDVILSAFNRILNRDNLHDIKVALPEGLIQARVVNINYKSIRNIYHQRINHRLKWWKENLDELVKQLKYPEFIV